MEIKEIKQQVRNNIKWSKKMPTGSIGGQQCGIPNYPVILKSEELDLEITFGYHRSQLKNKQISLILFELALDEIVK